MAFVKEPRTDCECQPDERGESESRDHPGARQPDPKDQRKTCEANAAYGSAKCIDARHDMASIGSVKAGASLVLFLVSLYETGASGEDRGEGKEEASDHWTEMLSDKAGDHADEPAENEANDPLVRLDAFDRGKLGLNDHGNCLTTSQNAKEAANHTGIRTTVAVKARLFK